jgi:hypothetical protein
MLKIYNKSAALGFSLQTHPHWLVVAQPDPSILIADVDLS